MKKTLIVSLAALAAATTVSLPAAALSLGQVDTFGSSLDGWFAGGGPLGATPPSPNWVAGGGPAGAGDGFMQVSSSGSAGAGGKLVAMNLTQWAGDYAAAGITAIAMDLRNLGATDITVRLYFEDPIPLPPSNEAVTSSGQLLAAGSGWTSVLFPVTAADLTVLQGSAATLLSNTTVLRLFHGPAADFPGPSSAAELGVDNVRAVPENSRLMLTLAGMAMLGLLVRRRR